MITRAHPRCMHTPSGPIQISTQPLSLRLGATFTIFSLFSLRSGVAEGISSNVDVDINVDEVRVAACVRVEPSSAVRVVGVSRK